MSKWGRVDYKQLNRLLKGFRKYRMSTCKIQRVANKTTGSKVSKNCNRTYTCNNRRVKARMDYRQGSKKSNVYEIEIINKKLYASYVEYGHRQQIGRYVKAIGNGL